MPFYPVYCLLYLCGKHTACKINVEIMPGCRFPTLFPTLSYLMDQSVIVSNQACFLLIKNTLNVSRLLCVMTQLCQKCLIKSLLSAGLINEGTTGLKLIINPFALTILNILAECETLSDKYKK